jgi:hypothetical protein
VIIVGSDRIRDTSDGMSPRTVEQLVAIAERLSCLAETAELMGDEGAAERFRSAAAERRRIALMLLDGRRSQAG